MLRNKTSRRSLKSNGGFSLFEFVVVVCLIAILYMSVDERLNDLPAQAERASFFTVLSQIEASLNIEVLNQILAHRSHEGEISDDSNPMNLLLEAPDNYLGNLNIVTDQNAKRGAWYFENSTGQLVYVVNNRSLEQVFVNLSGVMVNFGQIRLKVVNVYREAADINNVHKKWEGVLLQPVNSYQWESEAKMLTGVNVTN